VRGYLLGYHDWLKSYHSFSFADYYDPDYMGWGNLRVINEDCIEPDTGFGKHSHRNMEIISYVLSGELAHQDSLGNIKAIPSGDVQRRSRHRSTPASVFQNYSTSWSCYFLRKLMPLSDT
jgi:redox-sensitive bicupin YhaK (pirin superfamily)